MSDQPVEFHRRFRMGQAGWQAGRYPCPAIQQADKAVSRKTRSGQEPANHHSAPLYPSKINSSFTTNFAIRTTVRVSLRLAGTTSETISSRVRRMHQDFTIDRVIACLMLPLVLPVLAVLCAIVLLVQGRPFLFASERMRDADTPFMLYKIRTMRPPVPGAGEGVLGGHLKTRVTPLGAWLRRFRLDELPQIFNVIRGDIRFIGPRPPLRRHVAACPRRYRRLLAATRPGITGLATVMVHAREERLLSACRTAEEAERVYRRRCLPVKLRLDMIYLSNRSLTLDLLVLWRTFARLVSAERPGRQPVAPLMPMPERAFNAHLAFPPIPGRNLEVAAAEARHGAFRKAA